MKRKIFSLLLCSAMLSGAACGCGGDESTVKDSSSLSTVEESSDATETKEEKNFEYNGTFNEEVFEHIIQNININGVKISMPCSLNDMGKGFEVSFPLFFEKKSLSTYSLNYKDVYLGQIVYYSDHEFIDTELENEKFAQLYINPSEPYWGNLSVAGVEIGSDYKALERVLGQPTSKNYDGKDGFYTYKLSEKKYIEFHFMDNSIYSISINVK